MYNIYKYSLQNDCGESNFLDLELRELKKFSSNIILVGAKESLSSKDNKVITEYGVYLASNEGVLFTYPVKSKFIYGEKVKVIKGTERFGLIDNLMYHGKDKEFKFYIKEIGSDKILKRRYSPLDLELV